MSNAYCYDGSKSQLVSLRPTSCTTSGGNSFSYNANGDRTGTTNVVGGATVNSYGYNQNDQLISFGQGSSTASYAYDGTGLRTSKTVGGTTEGFVWDLAGGMPTILQDGTTRYITGPGGLPIEQVDGSGATQYYLQDQLGSTRGLLDSSGNVVGTYSFDAYGALKGHGGTASTPFGYAGQYTDSESGLEHLRARYYDPSTQQFLTMDPLVGATGDLYGYAGQNPVNAIDFSGLSCFRPAWACRATNTAGEALNAAGGAVNNALPAIHQGASAVAFAASICALVMTPTVAGGLVCGGIAGTASGVAAVTGVALWRQGRQSGLATGLDIVGLGLGLDGFLTEVGAGSAERLAQSANQLSQQHRAAMSAAPWYGKAVPWVASTWWAAKAALWNTVQHALKGTSVGFDLTGIGAFIYGVVCG